MTMKLHPILAQVTDRIVDRSRGTRGQYIVRMGEAGSHSALARQTLSCGNLAHAFAAAPMNDKLALRAGRAPNLGIVTAYNDMLSAHQPFGGYPDIIKDAAR